ncbi:MAG: Flp pilus assembly complex ATPase component TadA, partial [Candidatus Pacebacteria bacterium]|nr:Flp pilus assembly complex ATPase component TadA [Candidatus Paceibacterota bacterium]
MVHFDETQQNKKINLLHKQEEERLIKMLSEKYNIPYVFITPHLIDIEALSFLEENTARDACVAVFGKGPKKNLKVAVFSPHNEKTEKLLQNLQQKGFDLTIHMASKESLNNVWKHYKEISHAERTDVGVLDVTNDDISLLMEGVTSTPAVTQKIEELLQAKSARKLSRLFEIILSGAFAVKSSDIHMESQEEVVRIRYRIDGVLQDIYSIEQTLYRRMSTRIKLLSGLKLNVVKDTQDGRFSVRFKNTDIEVRTSVLPGQYGESIVLRILDPESISVPLEELGINSHLLSVLHKEISKPTGMILTTGPTGAGKTTTLYAFLKKTLQPNIKIITIEDPIEYHIKNIVQTQVSNKTNYTFLSGLRAALRQDPDIIMIG